MSDRPGSDDPENHDRHGSRRRGLGHGGTQATPVFLVSEMRLLPESERTYELAGQHLIVGAFDSQGWLYRVRLGLADLVTPEVLKAGLVAAARSV